MMWGRCAKVVNQFWSTHEIRNSCFSSFFFLLRLPCCTVFRTTKILFHSLFAQQFPIDSGRLRNLEFSEHLQTLSTRDLARRCAAVAQILSNAPLFSALHSSTLLVCRLPNLCLPQLAWFLTACEQSLFGLYQSRCSIRPSFRCRWAKFLFYFNL